MIGAGTGLGKAVLLPAGDGHFLGCPSEGGHASFAPETERELELCLFVKERFGGNYASCEDIVSGRGVSLIHEFLTGQKLAPAEAAAEQVARFTVQPVVVLFIFAGIVGGLIMSLITTAGPVITAPANRSWCCSRYATASMPPIEWPIRNTGRLGAAFKQCRYVALDQIAVQRRGVARSLAPADEPAHAVAVAFDGLG